MDHPSQYHSSHHSRQHSYSQTQLPPSSSLHLPMPSFSRTSNTLPPLASIPLDSRYPPASYHPSLSSPTGHSLPSPTGSHHPWPTHRTSSSREEVHPLRRRESKPKLMEHDQHIERAPPPVQVPQETPKDNEDGMPSTSDFVKKLYKMLEDSNFTHVVSWNLSGDAFVVKDMNEFTKSILPKMFKHSNFASFVRQLNKYDFHKVKNSDDNQFGEHSWTFKHPDFQADRRDALENIKRKVPAQRKPAAASSRGAGRTSPVDSPSEENGALQAMQAQIDRMKQTQDDMANHIRHLEHNYQRVLDEMVSFHTNIAKQDGLMQSLIHYFLQLEQSKVKQEPSNAGFSSDPNPFVPATEAQRMVGSYPESDVARASLEQLNEISRRASAAGMSFSNGIPNVSQPSGSASGVMAAAAMSQQAQGQTRTGNTPPASREEALQRLEELSRLRSSNVQQPPLPQREQQSPPGLQLPTTSQQSSMPNGRESFTNGTDPFIMPEMEPRYPPPPTAVPHSGLQVFTLGHLMPKSGGDDDSAIWSFDPAKLNDGTQAQQQSAGASYSMGEPSSSTSQTRPKTEEVPASTSASDESGGVAGSISRPESAQRLRVRRSTFVPGWAVPPRVLLVDDDAVSRKLSSKFLQVFGCTIDVAVDGVVAVNKMNLEKYDLVLMDIVMPKLDGVSATSLIRQFDHMTPIISMTSNSKPNEIMTYYSHGMNDILPKPFTKEGLLSMLEKHLTHLKVIQQMSKVPRSVGIPPLSDSSFDQALMVTAANPPQDEEGKINPLAGMGLSDETYAAILQNIVNGESFPGFNGGVGLEKRGLEDLADGREGKRGRFEVIE
ncbi:hypothetical protein BD410DRAFT_785604 [Rickenella mellea]|uniref:Response regulatory domain-containing protein n=1 Tax=Rickenella mellea TaxID=50990 RepID=A0A4Y7QCC4_9AGAM|nr:hypothetical protein BD410DRAFT_785604 [Rickenella mellea]